MVKNDPTLAVANDTPQELIALEDALDDFSDRLDDYIKDAPNPITPAIQQLRLMDTHIAADAATIGRIAVEQMAADVISALSELNVQITSAKSTLSEINNVKTAISIAAAVLSVAANVSTGNPLGAASSVVALVQTLQGAVSASKTP